jgi:hypothetical protein
MNAEQFRRASSGKIMGLQARIVTKALRSSFFSIASLDKPVYSFLIILNCLD